MSRIHGLPRKSLPRAITSAFCVNDKQVVDYVKDKKNTHSKGHFAIQQHPPAKDGPNSMITVKSVAVKVLPAAK